MDIGIYMAQVILDSEAIQLCPQKNYGVAPCNSQAPGGRLWNQHNLARK
jgi:hypothetical protein